ncbi:MAG: membrane protein insertion efficiency factor YidD [Verrucomicrobiota bacterium]
MRYLLIFLVRVYRAVGGPLKAMFGAAGCCRFQPTCSQYAIQALQLHGAFKGSWLALRRILRCHPWGGYGYDPVPGSEETHTSECEHSHPPLPRG